jgi:nucleotide-binding universal stress UspA family protein
LKGFRNLFHILKVEFRIEKVADIELALMNYTNKRKIDILAVHPRKKNIFTRLFSKSVSKQIAHHIKVPLLSLPA